MSLQWVVVQGLIDYSLAKRSALAGFRRGAVDRLDICDAHPDLVRAARNIGENAGVPCPVCARDSLRRVAYVYGDALRHLSGHPVYPAGWEQELAGRYDEFRCYRVEVCVRCAWNHLDSCWLMGRKFAEQQKPRTRKRGRTSIK